MDQIFCDTPLGRLFISALDEGLHQASFLKPFPDTSVNQSRTAYRNARLATEAVEDYFQGRIDAFSQIPLAPQGTEFQLAVWKALRDIPAGKVATYSDIASCIGKPKAVRAVGTACGKNPLLLFTPCHRVIGKGDSLGGFSAGLVKKKFLLEHERTLSIGVTVYEDTTSAHRVLL